LNTGLKSKKMALTAELKENWKEDKALLNNAISSLKKDMTDYKVERKSEWKTFKTKYNEEIERVEKSLKKMTTLHKK
jgi:hypothetical protein